MFMSYAANVHQDGQDPLSVWIPIINPVNMPVLGLYWACAGSIGPVQAQFWHIMASLQGN